MPRLIDPDEFWPVYQEHGVLVTSLVPGSREALAVWLDFLISEARVPFPIFRPSDAGPTISPPDKVQVWACMTPDDARLLHSRLAKRELLGGEECLGAFALYDPKFRQLHELCSATVGFVAGLRDYIQNDVERLIVATIQAFEYLG